MNHQGTGTAVGRRRIVVVGASVRAMAQSAAAAGWEVHAADLFGDLDLRASARDVIRLGPEHAYPHALVTLAAEWPPVPWCYTGALENHPDIIDAIAAVRRLAGNGGSAVRAVRDPLRLAVAVRSAGLLFPETFHSPDGLPCDGSFIVKPLASASGRGIHAWRPDAESLAASAVTHVWQRRVVGEPHAAAFIVAPGGARLLGLTRQLIGAPWCHAGPFSYCGSVTVPPSAIPRSLAAQLDRLGGLLADEFRLVGAVGIDLMIDTDGRIWVVEINPRFTASMELHERRVGGSVAAAHLHACGVSGVSGVSSDSPAVADDAIPAMAWAKAVLHAPHAIDVTTGLVAEWQAMAAAWSAADGGPAALADIPAPGQTIPVRAPLLTIFARGTATDAALAGVTHRTADVVASCQPAFSRPFAAALSPPPRCTHTA